MSSNVRAFQNIPAAAVTVRDARESDADAVVALSQALAKFEEVGDSAFTKEHFLKYGFGEHASFTVIVAEQEVDTRGQQAEPALSRVPFARQEQAQGNDKKISASAGMTHEERQDQQTEPTVSSQRVVGFLMYYPGFDLATASHGAHLADVFVNEYARGQGAGRSLIRELARRTLAAGGEWVSWTVLKKNRAAKKFYTGLGASNVNVDFMAWGASSLKKLSE